MRFARQILITGLLLWGTCILYAETSTRFTKIESPNLNKKELDEVLSLLGIKVSEPINLTVLDTKLKKIYSEGSYELLFLDVVKKGNDNVLVIKGNRLKRISKITFHGLEDSLAEEFKRDPEVRESRMVGSKYLARVRTRIEGMLEQRGYFYSKTELKITESEDGKEFELEVFVEKNKPTIIERIAFKGVSEDLEDEIRSYVSFSVGDTFTKTELVKSVESINRFFKQNQYPTTRIDDTTLIFSQDKLEVEVVFLIKQGEKYQFQFSGNTVYPDVILREFLTDEVLSQADATNKIVTLIENKYKSVGYHFCQVKIENKLQPIEKLNTVYFKIDEGKKLLIDRVDFNGGERVGHSTLSKWMYEEAPGVLARGVYWENGLQEMTQKLQARMRNEGYLSATVSTPRTVISEDRAGAELIFEVQPGQRTFFGAIQLEGVQKLDKEAIYVLVKQKNTEPFNVTKLEAIKNTITNLYLREGYSDIQVKGGYSNGENYSISQDQKQADVKLLIVEGQQYYVGDVFVEGNKRTDADVIERELRLKRGDKYDLQKVRGSEDDISQLGLFSRVEIITSTSPKSNSIKDLRIIVVETKRGFGEVGLGGSYIEPRFRARTFLGLAYKNLFGRNQTASARTEINVPFSDGKQLIPFMEYAAVLGYRLPYPLALPFTFSSQAGLDRFEVATTEENSVSKIQTRSRIEQKIERKVTSFLTVYYRLHRFVHTKNEDLALKDRPLIIDPNDPAKKIAPPGLGDPVIEDIGSTGPGFILDFRDEQFNPTKGTYHLFDFEVANKKILSQSNFYMATLRNSFYIPLFYNLGLTIYIGGAFAECTEELGVLPKTRRVYDLALGGQGSIRGYNLRRFAPDEDSHSAAFYNTRFEVTIPLYPNISAAIFLDSGQIYSRKVTSEWVTAPRYDGIGIGLRYKTPVGPIVFDMAEGLTAPGKGVKFLFTIGTF